VQRPNLKIGFVAKKTLTSVLSESSSNNANVISQLSHKGLKQSLGEMRGDGDKGRVKHSKDTF